MGRLELPERVTVVDVAARDGLQSFGRWVETDVKVALVDRLTDAGFPVIEVTGMARAEVIPNLRDAEAVLARIRRRPDTVYRALVPNARGAQRAAEAPVPPDELLGLVVASETYLRKNQRMDTERAVSQAIEAHRIAESAGMSYVVAIAGAFWDIYEGPTPPDKVLALVERFHDAGIRKVYLAGSLGVEDPVRVHALFSRVCERWPGLVLGYHVHNLAGVATANVLAALQAGAAFVEGSICGLGGGIAMPGQLDALGNLASEDLVYLLNEMGVQTGITTEEAVRAARDVARLLGIDPVGHVARCGARSELFKGVES
ncbi:MAG: hydroxymethylglutaryl-CoA lyase [Pseudomonadota bacterium]|jgi:hydroxymethylglutaryl-CoA lyase